MKDKFPTLLPPILGRWRGSLTTDHRRRTIQPTTTANNRTMKSRNQILHLAAIAGLAIPANAAVVVTPDHISTNPGIVGTLVAIDVPYVATLPYTGGPDWTVAADDGFQTVDQPVQETWTSGRWEPDGTPQSENRAYQTYPNGNPNVSFTFNLAASGIDIPDGSTINGVYATWATRSNLWGRYSYAEVTSSGSVDLNQSANPATNLGLDWTDDGSTVRTAPFQLIFSGPITVGGGDGFTVEVDRYQANAASIDAVVLDVTIIPEPSISALFGLTGIGFLLRRRRGK